MTRQEIIDTIAAAKREDLLIMEEGGTTHLLYLNEVQLIDIDDRQTRITATGWNGRMCINNDQLKITIKPQ